MQRNPFCLESHWVGATISPVELFIVKGEKIGGGKKDSHHQSGTRSEERCRSPAQSHWAGSVTGEPVSTWQKGEENEDKKDERGMKRPTHKKGELMTESGELEIWEFFAKLYKLILKLGLWAFSRKLQITKIDPRKRIKIYSKKLRGLLRMLHSPLKCHGHSDDFTEEFFQNIKEKNKDYHRAQWKKKCHYSCQNLSK